MNKALDSEIQKFSFLKTEFGIFQFQAPGNSGRHTGSSRVPSVPIALRWGDSRRHFCDLQKFFMLSRVNDVPWNFKLESFA